MTTNEFALLATIILIFPMLYFLLVTPTFLLRPLSDPIVTRLLRGLFNVYFLVVSATCGLAALAFLLANRPLAGVGFGLVAGLAFGARRWFLMKIDAALDVRDAGDLRAVVGLRRLHWAGMLYNAIQFFAIASSIPRLFPVAA